MDSEFQAKDRQGWALECALWSRPTSHIAWANVPKIAGEAPKRDICWLRTDSGRSFGAVGSPNFGSRTRSSRSRPAVS